MAENAIWCAVMRKVKNTTCDNPDGQLYELYDMIALEVSYYIIP